MMPADLSEEIDPFMKRAPIQSDASGSGKAACVGACQRWLNSVTSFQWQKTVEFGISRRLSAARGSEVLAKRLVAENHAPTLRMIRPNGAGEPSEFDVFLPFGAASAVEPTKASRMQVTAGAANDAGLRATVTYCGGCGRVTAACATAPAPPPPGSGRCRTPRRRCTRSLFSGPARR